MSKALFLCADPFSFIPYKDTTKVLMEEAARRGQQVYACTHRDLEFCNGIVLGHAIELELTANANDWFVVKAKTRIPLEQFDSIWFREDPPFDEHYLHATQLVELAPGPKWINHPKGLRAANEKLFALQFADLIPPTLISRDFDEIKHFVQDHGGVAVTKPLDGFGGQGIFKLQLDDPNVGSILQTATLNQSTPTIVQKFIPEIVNGDMRILLMDGEFIGAFHRVPQGADFRGNMMQGGVVQAVELSERELQIIEQVRPVLRENGLRLVGLDVIGSYLTEINVTSPTGFQEVFKLSGHKPEEIVWDKVLELA